MSTGSNTFAAATPIGLGETSDVTPNDALTPEGGEPYPRDGLTAWWKFTATEDRWVGFDTALSTPDPISADTLIAVYTGTSVDDLTPIDSPTDGWGSDDDSLDGFTTRVAIHVTAGTTYYIQVDAYSDGIGYVLRCRPLTQIVLRPVGDVVEANTHTSIAVNELPPTIVGSGAVCSDDDDATYVELTATQTSDTSSNRRAMFAFPARPDIFKLEKIRVRATVNASSTGLAAVWSWMTLSYGTSSAAPAFLDTSSLGASPGWYDTSSSSDSASRPLSDPSDDLLAWGTQALPPGKIIADGELGFVLEPHLPFTFGATAVVRVYEVEFHALVVDTLPPVTRLKRRPLRQFPRSDGLGISSARRVDADRSMQSTLRRGGGVYF